MNPRLALALAACAACAAARAAATEDHRFGVMTHFAHGWDPSEVALVAEGGITDVRDELYWNTVEPERGKYRFPAQYDRYMAGLARAGISPLVVLDFENANYDGGLTPHTPEGCAAYARYALEVLRRYGRQIRAVEVWNEYNGTFCTGPATQDRAGSYLRMLKAVYVAIKRERPDVIVAAGATSGVPLPYWEKLLAGGALDYLDVLSVHPYRYSSAPEGLENDVGRLQELVRRYNHGQDRPLWVTEIGWDARRSTAPGDLAIDDEVQAEFLVRAYALLLSAGVQRVYWYVLQDGEGLHMGLRRGDEAHTAKPAFVALATLARELRGARFVRRETTPDNFYSLVFSRPSGEEVRVLWSLRQASVPAAGVARAVDIEGRARAPGPALAVAESPLFVTGRLADLPARPKEQGEMLADSQRDFSSFQGERGWSYGVFVDGSFTFVPLSNLQVTDWTEAWAGPFPYVSVTATDQHPSASGPNPVSAVRRWESNFEGEVRISGRFRCGTQGDGVGVSVLVDGERLFRAALGGGHGRPVIKDFDWTGPVHPGTCIDFAVDPGSGLNIDYDATEVSAQVRAISEP